MALPEMQNNNYSKIGRFLNRLTNFMGDILFWGGGILIHGNLLNIICSKLGIDFHSYPDTLEYRLIFAYLILTQFAFIVWVCPRVNKLLEYLVKPIKILGNILEEKIKDKFESDQIEDT